MVPIEISSPHSYSTSTHNLGLSCTVWPQKTQRVRRQTDRAIRIGRLCYSVGGLIKVYIYIEQEREQSVMNASQNAADIFAARYIFFIPGNARALVAHLYIPSGKKPERSDTFKCTKTIIVSASDKKWVGRRKIDHRKTLRMAKLIRVAKFQDVRAWQSRPNNNESKSPNGKKRSEAWECCVI